MNRKKKEGDFYASKVRQFLNEWRHQSARLLQGRAGKLFKDVQLSGRAFLQKPSASPGKQATEETPDLLPNIEIQVLLVDAPKERAHCGQTSVLLTSREQKSPSSGFSDVVLHFGKGLVINIGNCSARSLATFIKEMEVKPC